MATETRENENQDSPPEQAPQVVNFDTTGAATRLLMSPDHEGTRARLQQWINEGGNTEGFIIYEMNGSLPNGFNTPPRKPDARPIADKAEIRIQLDTVPVPIPKADAAQPPAVVAVEKNVASPRQDRNHVLRPEVRRFIAGSQNNVDSIQVFAAIRRREEPSLGRFHQALEPLKTLMRRINRLIPGRSTQTT